MTRQPVTDDNALSLEYVDLETLIKWPGNPKQHDLGAIAASMIRFGFRDPLAVNRNNNFIEEGHGRLDTLVALKRQRRPPPAFIGVDEEGRWYAPVLWFNDDDVTQHGYSLAHNRTQELGGPYDDAHLLAALLEQQQNNSLEGTGFDHDDVDALRRKLATEESGDQSAALRTSFQVLVTCQDEQQQVELIGQLEAEGLTCRALIS